ncbi:Nonribosomal peptide synthase [Sinosporangium album]|uniref:Nonribosomal peptide synthase n=1 Tax=Sinosporangium album TaxID=504805 RepID=A0A1G8GP45_9ACTN|nr:condensation domain-containing protein [Sinosporangium album]SDH96139.1 Nonribosomal peptide synthase [Sinosporangium album]
MGDDLPDVVAAPGARFDPFPLTDTQRAYAVGRTGLFPLGGVASNSYFEFDGPLDRDRFTSAWRRLIDRHDALRLVVSGDAQRVLAEVPPYGIEVAADGDAVRRDLASKVRDPATWPLFDVVISDLPGGDSRVHIGFDGLILDYMSWQILMTELTVLYHDPDAELLPPSLSFRDYVLAASGLPATGRYGRAEKYWAEHLPALPAAPALPYTADPADPADPTVLAAPSFTRRGHTLPAGVWARVKRGARGMTSAGILLAAVAEVLAAHSRSAHFTLNIPRGDRFPLHPGVTGAVGVFASFWPLHVDFRKPLPFAERAANLQRRMWADLTHPWVSGVRLVRDLARLRGEYGAPMFPVVVTVLPPGTGVPLLGGTLPRTWGLTQTPQVALDVRVEERDGGVAVDWDSVDDLFPEGFPALLGERLQRLLHALADDESLWAARAPLDTLGGPPGLGDVPLGVYAPPSTPLERLLARTVAEECGVERVGRHDDLAALGGDLAAAARIAGRLSDLGLGAVRPRALTAAGTVAGLAAALVGQTGDGTGGEARAGTGGAVGGVAGGAVGGVAGGVAGGVVSGVAGGAVSGVAGGSADRGGRADRLNRLAALHLEIASLETSAPDARR